MNFQLENNKLYCWQWDTKQKLIIKDFEDWDDSFFILIGNSKVQKELFKIKPDKEIDDFFVKIPDEILQKEGTAEVYIYNEGTGTTVSAWRFTIKKKDKPQDYIYEKTEVLTLVQLQNEIEKISEQTIPELAKELKNFVAEEISKVEPDNIKIDSSLSKEGFAADAKAVGDKLEQKVEKIEGKSLSSNDFTNTYKRKLDEALTSETDPTVPEWAKQSSKPTYNAAEVGALPDTTELLELDNTLKEAGKAADAKIVGDAFIAEREYTNSQRLGWIEGGDIHTIDPKFIITNGKRNNVLAIGDIDENNFPNKLISLSGIGGIINENEFLEILPKTRIHYQDGFQEIKGEFLEVKINDELKIIFNDEEYFKTVIDNSTIQPDSKGWYIGNLGLHPLSDFIGAFDDGTPFLAMFSPDGVMGDSEPSLAIIIRDGSIRSTISIYKNITEIIKINPKIIPLAENETVGGVKAKTSTINAKDFISIDKDGYLVTDSVIKAKEYTDSQRLGYVDFAKIEVVAEQEYEGFPQESPPTSVFIFNNIQSPMIDKIVFSLDGTPYECEKKQFQGEEFWGNLNIALVNGQNSGEPFFIFQYKNEEDTEICVYIAEEDANLDSYKHIIAIYAISNEEIVHQIDEKFIPNTIVRSSELNNLRTDINNINFLAEYGVTSYSALTTAANIGQKIWVSWPEKNVIVPITYYKNNGFNVYFMEDFDTVYRISCDSTNGWSNGTLPLQTKNITQVISTSPSTTQYPSEKAVADALSNILPKVTSADTGSFLRVSSEGKWIAEILTNVAEVGA